MSTSIGVALGEFGLIAADTRLSEGPDGPHNDRDPWLLNGQVMRTDRDRKLKGVPGPAWAVCGGLEALTGVVALESLAETGVGNLETVQEVVQAAGPCARQIVAELGYNVPEEDELAFAGNGVALLRPGPEGVEYHLVEPEASRGGPGIVDVWPPQPLTIRQTRKIQRRHLESVARRPDVTNGELLLAVARTVEEMRSAGAWSISGRVHCGMLLQAAHGSSARAVRVDFDCAELMDRYAPNQVESVLLSLFHGAAPGSPPPHVDLTEAVAAT